MSVRKASSYYMNNHSNVKVTKHESGLMVPIGLRFYPRLGAIVNYQKCLQKRKEKTLLEMSDRDQHLALVDFNQLFMESSVWFSRSLLHSIKKLKGCNNILKVKRDGQLLNLLPTYMVSNLLHNSMHINGTDATSSFSIFYQEQINTGLSYLVFPEISLAVELQSPVLVKWDGAHTLHGTIMVDSGITSMFESAKTLVGKRRKISEAFKNCIKRSKVNTIFVGSTVFVRDTFRYMSKDDSWYTIEITLYPK